MNNSEIKKMIADMANLPVDMLEDNELLTDLLVDSFAIIDLSIAIQDKLEIIFIQQDLAQLDTVGDLVSLIQTKITRNTAA